jgi:small subunit ribosomal protein S17
MAEEQTHESAEPATPTTGAQDQPGSAGPASGRAPRSQEILEPKERRRRGRAVKAAKAKPRPARTAEERHAERVSERRAKAEVRRGVRVRTRTKARAAAGSSEPTAPREHPAGVQKVRQGVVVSDRADKTITVRIDTARRHRRYDKIVRTSRTLHAHDESNDAHIGDTVTVREARPLSRTKRWRLVAIIERAK